MAKTKTARVPFKITTEPPYAAELRQSLAELERGEYKTFDTTEELFAELNSDDEDDDEI